MRCETALGADTALLDRVLARLSGTLGNPVRSLVDTRNHLLLVLELGELRGDHTKDNILVLGQVLERLEATGAGCIVLEVVCVDVQVLEELLRNVVVCALGEVTAADVVTTAKMNAKVHVRRSLEALVVKLDVCVEHLVGGLVVGLVGGPALQHVL